MKRIRNEEEAIEHLNEPANAASYLNGAAAHGDVEMLMICLEKVAKARGMSKLADKAGLARGSIYRALQRESKPHFETIMKIAGALDMNITFTPRAMPLFDQDKSTK